MAEKLKNPMEDGACRQGEEKKSDAVFSFFALLAKTSIYKVAAIIIAMAAAEIGLFFLYTKKYSDYRVGDDFYNRPVFIIFLLALGLVYTLLMQTEYTMGSQGRDTLRRLRLSETKLFLIEIGYNLLCLMLVFAVQIWLAIGMACAFHEVTAHYLFLTFYRIEFLHCLLPMDETGKWVRNFLLLFAFAIGAACGCQKRDYTLSVLILLITIPWFVSPIGMGFTDVVCCCLYAVEVVTGLCISFGRAHAEL